MEQLDPTIMNLTKAIRQTETGGNYSASGKSGEYGAYQFTEPTWNKLSQKYGIKVPLKQATKEQQNEAAYKQIAEWKAQGKNVGQIASMWNAGEGEPDAYKGTFSSGKTATGRNKYGVQYDVPTYAKSVAEAYQKIKNGGYVPADPNNPSSTASMNTVIPPSTQGPESGVLGTNPNDNLYGKLVNNSISRGIQNFFPGKQVGEAIGTLGGYLASDNKEQYDVSAPTPIQVAGDVAQGALTVGAAPAIKGASSVAGRIGIAGLEGAAFGGTGAIAEGKPIAEVGKEAAIGGALGAATGGLLEGAGALYKGASKLINGKTAQEILNTAEKDVSKLSTKEQQFWYSQQSKAATETANKASLAAKQAGEKATQEVKQEINNINQKIGETSREQAITLKKPAQQVMKDASEHYVELTGEAVENSKALGKKLTHEDLASAIESKFEYDPQIANSLKNDLALTSPKPRFDETGAEIIEANAPKLPEITNQEILDKAREIMQSVSKTARQGNKVYSPAEYEAMQKYSFLMETLGKNGVDMSAANKFWKEYAPVRDRIVRELKPFEETNIGKIPFTSTLNNAESVAKTSKQVATQLDAKNFIAELESRMGIPKGSIGADIRKEIEGLEKAKLSKDTIAKITKEAAAQIKADKAEALKTMSLKKYNDSVKAHNREIIRKVIMWAIGLTAASKIAPAAVHVVGAVL